MVPSEEDKEQARQHALSHRSVWYDENIFKLRAVFAILTALLLGLGGAVGHVLTAAASIILGGFIVIIGLCDDPFHAPTQPGEPCNNVFGWDVDPNRFKTATDFTLLIPFLLQLIRVVMSTVSENSLKQHWLLLTVTFLVFSPLAFLAGWRSRQSPAVKVRTARLRTWNGRAGEAAAEEALREPLLSLPMGASNGRR